MRRVGDEHRLEAAIPDDVLDLVVANVVSNAVRHPRAIVRMTITLRAGEIQIAVEDDGPGVRAEDAETIFEPFGAPRRGPGVGLGLSIASRAVNRFGGRLEVGASNLGGASFTIVLPGSVAPAPPGP